MIAKRTFEDLTAIRQLSQPLTGAIAPTTSSDFFKSEESARRARSKDFNYRLSLESTLREPATLKAAGADLTTGVVSLATGRPSPEYYPLVNISFSFVRSRKHGSERDAATIPSTKNKQHLQDHVSSNELPVALSYGYSQGSEANIRFLTEHTELVHDPPYANWEVCMTVGSTSAIEHALRMFCARGDYVLMEEYTYSGALEAMKPLGLRSKSIMMDEQGMLANHLEAVLTNWDIRECGAPKPFLLYTIPTGQNPTGVTQSIQRRKDIYAVAEKHDLFIIEDDPYYYLHYAPQTSEPDACIELSSEIQYLHSLPVSYLSMDVSGRVLRLDSTSKILAPGLRCGWMTANSDIIAKILSHHDVGIVSPSGLTQLMMGNLLEDTWGHEGFMRWLIDLRNQYSRRCEILVTACEDHLPKDTCSWRCPEAGMFLWVKLEWRQHILARSCGDKPTFQAFNAVENSVFSRALSKGSLVCKGSAFHSSSGPPEDMFIRLTFATASFDELVIAIKRLGDAVREEFWS
ncbi:hypothetical protein MBLNU13_g11319t1 [Cladosporium sp. NU13]